MLTLGWLQAVSPSSLRGGVRLDVLEEMLEECAEREQAAAASSPVFGNDAASSTLSSDADSLIVQSTGAVVKQLPARAVVKQLPAGAVVKQLPAGAHFGVAETATSERPVDATAGIKPSPRCFNHHTFDLPAVSARMLGGLFDAVVKGVGVDAAEALSMTGALACRLLAFVTASVFCHSEPLLSLLPPFLPMPSRLLVLVLVQALLLRLLFVRSQG
jgi:hypothetical protein